MKVLMMISAIAINSKCLEMAVNPLLSLVIGVVFGLLMEYMIKMILYIPTFQILRLENKEPMKLLPAKGKEDVK